MTQTMLAVNEHVHWQLRPDPDAPVTDIASFGLEAFPVVPTAEGHWIVVAGHPAAMGTFAGLCRVTGRDDLRHNPRLATVAQRVERVDEIVVALAAWSVAQTDLAAIEAAFAAEGLAIGVVRTVREIAGTDWAAARRAIVDVDDRGGGTVRIPNSPWQFSDATTGVTGVPAFRGEHNREVLTELLDLDDTTIDRLQVEGVLSARLPAGDQSA